MEEIAVGPGDRGIATLRYQFPYMEKGSKRPDVPAVAHAAVRAAVAEAARGAAGRSAVGGRQILWRSDDFAGAGDSTLAGVRGLSSSAFRCIPPESPPASARRIWAEI